MLGKASFLAIPALLIPLAAATPAAAQSPGGDADAPAYCLRTISQPAGEASAAVPAPAPDCNAPREKNVHGGWLAHAIMLVGTGPRLPHDAPTRAAMVGWEGGPARLPSFARRPNAY